jgi:hypothetical protein
VAFVSSVTNAVAMASWSPAGTYTLLSGVK